MSINDRLREKESRKRIYFVLKLLLYLCLIFLLRTYPDLPKHLGIQENVSYAILFYIVSHLAISFGRIVSVFLYIRRHKLNKNVKNNFIIGINRIADILYVVVLIIALLLLWGKDPLQFITSLSIAAAAIAILSKDYISNMINGMIIMFADELSIGDFVKIGDQTGKVIDITLVNIHLVNDDEDLIYIPNSQLFTSTVINYTKRTVKKVSFDFDIKNQLVKEVADLEKHLTEKLKEYKKFIDPKSFNLKVVKINESYTSFKFQFILLKEVDRETERTIRKKTLRSVLSFMAEESHGTKSSDEAHGTKGSDEA